MRAKLEELRSKYYSTVIVILNDDGESIGTASICISYTFNPSDRELSRSGFTREEWNNDEKIIRKCGWTGEMREYTVQEYCDFEWSHTETQESYEAALKIVDAINR